MILIYSNNDSPRLRYICRFIFNEQLGIDHKIFTERESFSSQEGFKINYSREAQPDDSAFHIYPHVLLFQYDIRKQNINCEKETILPSFFSTAGRDLHYDIFAASFYLISRYEEYLPHEKDEFGRFPHSASLAFREGFLNKPLVNMWILELAGKLKKKFPEISFRKPAFTFLPTYDIDIAFSYKHKGALRLLGGFMKEPSLRRISVLIGKTKDPFDIYDELDALHEKYSLHPLYFFLAAEKKGRYDKNNCIRFKEMRSLIRRHASAYTIGIHPSWKSNENVQLLRHEKEIMENVCEKNMENSRQHYIKFELPLTYRQLIDCNIRNEYSMGYGRINGFRASVASSFHWYDLVAETETDLRIHPFCYMDANCYYEEKLDVAGAYDELLYYFNACRSVNGTLITIFHNMFMADTAAFRPWKENYLRFIAQMEQ